MMGARDNGCDLVDRILALQDGGEEPSEEELSTATKHLASCEACRTLVGSLEFLGRDPVPPLAEGKKDRLLRRVVTEVSGPPSPRRPLLFWPAVAGAGILGIVLIWSWVISPTGSRRGSVTPPARLARTESAATPAPLALMVSGRGTRPEMLASIAARLAAGETVDTGGRRVAFQLRPHYRFLADPESRLALPPPGRSGIELALVSGCLMGAVTRAPTEPLLAVSTPAGRVEVTGTAFSVCTGSRGSRVRVIEGRVHTTSPTGLRVEVGPTLAADIGTNEHRPLTSSEQREVADKKWILDQLADSASARLVVTTKDGDALVDLDGRFLGETPLIANLTAGERRLSVESWMPGLAHDERIELVPEKTVTRELELGEPEPEPPPAEKPDGKTSPLPRVKSADDLLRTARSHRAAEEWRAAAISYRRLVRLHPRSAQGLAARVSLGEILLVHLDRPRAADAMFESYLDRAPNGPLAEEAEYGRIRALHLLGETNKARERTAAFRKRFPRSVHLDELK